jgi:L-threonylcarbamoyladenylate synthase
LYHEALQHLRKGEIILFPSDTTWVLACDARNEKSVEKLLKVQQSTDNEAINILISKIEQLSEYVWEVPEIAWNLVEFAEKPLTVIYPKGKNLPLNVQTASGMIAIRLVKDEFCKGLVHKFERAIACVAVDTSEKTTIISLENIGADVMNGVNYILKNPNGDTKNFKPQQVVKLGLGGEFEFIKR